MAKDESMKHENKESKKMESKETKLETKGYRETMSGKMKKTMKMKKGGIAKGCGAVLSNRRKKTKVY